MMETKKQAEVKETINLFILNAVQVGKKLEADSKFSEMVYKGFINQLNKKQGNVPLIDH